jgi:C-terminal processing protease CtpA/Prc
LKETFKTIREEKIKKLIIDIRYNSGGNSSLNDLLIPYLSRRKYRQSSGRYLKVSPSMKEAMRKDSVYIQAFGADFVADYLAREDGTSVESLDVAPSRRRRPEYCYKGRHCVLIGPKTFSSANFLADAIATYKLSTLIGQPTGELTNDFGEQIEIPLPKTGVILKVSTAYDIGADGNPLRKMPVQPHILEEGDALGRAKTWLRTRR